MTLITKPRPVLQRAFCLIAAAFIVFAFGAIDTEPAKANSTVLASVYNSRIGQTVQVRQGGWNGTSGYGYSKICDYHKLCTVDGLRWIYASTNYTVSGKHYNLNAWVRQWVCSTTCVVKSEVQIRAVYNSNTYNTYYGYNVGGGKLGAQTAYCLTGSTVCPSWVAIAARNEHYNSNSMIAGGAPQLSTKEQSPVMLGNSASEAELQAAGAAHVDGASVYYTRSYEPLG